MCCSGCSYSCHQLIVFFFPKPLCLSLCVASGEEEEERERQGCVCIHFVIPGFISVRISGCLWSCNSHAVGRANNCFCVFGAPDHIPHSVSREGDISVPPTTNLCFKVEKDLQLMAGYLP